MIEWRTFLKRDPKVCDGDLCAAGTRVSLNVILDNLAEGLGTAEILRSYPSLRPEHIAAALAYASELVRERKLRSEL